MRKIKSVGGMHRERGGSTSAHAHASGSIGGLKPVKPPIVPGQKDDTNEENATYLQHITNNDRTGSHEGPGHDILLGGVATNHHREAKSSKPGGGGEISSIRTLNRHFQSVSEDQGIDMALSPGRDSLGQESTASYISSSSATSGAGLAVGCRNSTTSIDSGRDSSSSRLTITAPVQTAQLQIHARSGSTFAPLPLVTAGHIQPRPVHQFQTQRPCTSLSFANANQNPAASNYRQSYHSSCSSLGSIERGEDTICRLNVNEMIASGLPDYEVLNAWLTDLNFEDYYELFTTAGYDMPTITRMTPEDLTAIGIQKPNHRKKLKSDIEKLNIGDGIPDFLPAHLEEWLTQIRLLEYLPHLRSQGYLTVEDVTKISIEDLEDVGIYKLGHQKRFILAVKRIKDLHRVRRMPPLSTIPQAPAPAGTWRVKASVQPNSAIVSTGLGSTFSQNQSSSLMQEQHPYSAQPLQPTCTYQPEVIKIGPPTSSLPTAAPAATAVPIAPVSPIKHDPVPSMPHPMRPLSGFPRYTCNRLHEGEVEASASSFQHTLPESSSKPPTSCQRSCDDGNLFSSQHGTSIRPSQDKQQRFCLQSTAPTTTGPGRGGGTLPRPRGLVKPIPQISHTTSLQRQMSAEAIPDHSIKLDCWNGSPTPLSDKQKDIEMNRYAPPHPVDLISAAPSLSAQTAPAQSKVTTLPSTPANYDESMGCQNEPEMSKLSTSPAAVAAAAATTATAVVDSAGTNNLMGKRSTGDVLNDIGSMLADLTDELDAMLHTDNRRKTGQSQ